MAHFEELQELWQQQAETPVSHKDAETLASGLRKFGRRQDIINIAKSLLIVGQLIYMVTKFRHYPVRLFGATLVDCCVIYFLLWEWRNQRAVARLNFAARSVDFLRTAIARLEALRNPFRGREFYIMMGGFWVGCNIMMSAKNWIVRLLITAIPFAIYYPGVYLRAKRWDHEAGPLVKRLKELVEAAEERRA